MAIDAPEDQWIEGMTLNFDRHRQLTQALLPNFLGLRSGSIISISGNLEPEVVNAAMVAKAGLVVWSKGLSEQLGPHGVTVNNVCPNHVTTGLGAWQNEYFSQVLGVSLDQYMAQMAGRIPMGRPGLPSDTANAVAFLCSDEAGYITAESLNVSGGEEPH